MIVPVLNARDTGPGTFRAALELASVWSKPESVAIVFKPMEKELGSCKREALAITIKVRSELVLTGKACVDVYNASGESIHIRPHKKATGIRLLRIDSTGSLKFHKKYRFVFSGGGGPGIALGGGVYVSSPEARVSLGNVEICGCEAKFGGGLFSRAPIDVDHLELYDNKATLQGGGAYLFGVSGSTLVANHNRVLKVGAECGGGALYIDQGDLAIKDLTLWHNSVAYDAKRGVGGGGGALVLMAGNLVCERPSIRHNRAWNYAAVEFGVGQLIGSGFSISDNQSFNSASGAAGGGAIAITKGHVILADSEINDNETQGMFASGILSLVADVRLDACHFARNSNRGPGVVAGNFHSRLHLKDCTFEDNTSSSLGGTVVNFSGPTGSVVLEHCVHSGNVVNDEQTIDQTIASFLSVIEEHSANVSAQALTLEKETGIPCRGGAQHVHELKQLLARDAKETYEQLQELKEEWRGQIGGGAVATLLACPIRASGTRITRNETRIKHCGNCGNGGGIFAVRGTISLRKTHITQNIATSRGGGVFNGTSLKFIGRENEIELNKLVPRGETCPVKGTQIYNAKGAIRPRIAAY